MLRINDEVLEKNSLAVVSVSLLKEFSTLYEYVTRKNVTYKIG